MMIGNRAEALEPGETKQGRIAVGKLASGAPVALPYMIARGDQPHPVLWVNATVHGNESQATIAAIEFFRSLEEIRLSGTVVVTPLANPLAFDARTKHTPFDLIDLDQSFSSRATGFTTERIAERLFGEIAGYADVVVNLHTVNPTMDAAVYGVYKQVAHEAYDEKAILRLLALFEPFVACRMSLDGRGELPGNIGGALDYQVLALGKPSFMVEVGASGGWNDAQIRQTVDGLNAVAVASGVADRQGAPQNPRQLCRVTRRTHVTCTGAGLFRPLIAPGTRLEVDQPLGEIRNIYGKLVEVIRFPEPVLVIAVRSEPVVHVGDRVAFVAQEWEQLSGDILYSD